MKKRLMTLIVAILVVLSAAFAYACTPPASLTLSQNEVTLAVYDTVALTATGATEVTYTSSDASIVTVDENGTLLGLKEGTATITAKAGELSATCAVTVTAATAIPSLELSSDLVELITSNTYNLTASVQYKGESQSDAVITYSVADEDIATVAANGQITGVSIGDTTVTVAATWRGADSALLTEEVPVKVRGNVVVNFAHEQITLATADMTADGGYANQIVLDATATIDGQAATVSYEIDSEGDAGVVALDGTTLTAVGAGATRVRAVVTSGGDNYYSIWRDIVVEYAVFDRTATTLEYLLTQDTLTFDADTLLGEDIEVVSIKDGDVVVANGTTFNKSSMIAGLRTYRVETANAAYLFNAEVISIKIMNKTDLDNMLSAIAVAGTTNKFAGYVVLGANINYGGEAYNYYSDETRTLVRGEGFTGTFDGRGYTIYDIKFTDLAGMFGYPAAGAVIKNVAFEDVTFAASGGSNWGAMIFGQHCYATSIENVFVSVKSVTGNARVIADECGNANFGLVSLNNVVIDATNFPATQKIIASYGAAPVCQNVAIVTPNDNIGSNSGAVKYADMGTLMSEIASMNLSAIWATSGTRVGFNKFAPVIKESIIDQIGRRL